MGAIRTNSQDPERRNQNNISTQRVWAWNVELGQRNWPWERKSRASENNQINSPNSIFGEFLLLLTHTKNTQESISVCLWMGSSYIKGWITHIWLKVRPTDPGHGKQIVYIHLKCILRSVWYYLHTNSLCCLLCSLIFWGSSHQWSVV